MAKHCPGVVHVDNTARPQILSESDNPSMHKILTSYYEITGLPCLINTSFNMHEEPIVCTPGDAIRAFSRGHLDYLAMGSWLLKNKTPLDRNVSSSRYEALLNKTGCSE
jgi:carbamoyltransferase